MNVKQLAKRSGAALFIFYTIKGLLWLIIPALIALNASGSN